MPLTATQSQPAGSSSSPSAFGPSAASDLSRRLLWPAVGAWALVKGWLSWTRYFNQDEFESLHQGWLWFSGAVPYQDFNSNHPPLAFELLGLLNYLTGDATEVMRLGRALTFLSAAIVLFFLYKIGRSVYGAKAARWTVIIYALTATFCEWSTEVRTDFLMIPLWLAAVWVLVAERPKKPAWRLFLVGLLLGTAFWVNQKVVFHAVPIGIFLLIGGPTRRWRPWQVWIALVGSLVPTAAVLGQATVRGSLASLIDRNFGAAWDLTVSDSYFLWCWTTLSQALVRDLGFVVLAVLATRWAMTRKRDRTQAFVTLASLWMLLTLFLTPGPFPYYLLSVFPLFAVAIGGFLATSYVMENKLKNEMVLAGCLALYLAFPLLRMTTLAKPTSPYQFRVVRLAGELTDPTTAVFDGAGALVTRPDAYRYHWVLWVSELRKYREGRLPPLVDTLRQNDCRLVVDTYRLDRLPEADVEALHRQFVSLWGPIRVPGYDSTEPVGERPVEFELWYDGLYEVNQPGVLVDGQPVEDTVRLSRGRHTLAVAGTPTPVRLRDAAHRDRVTLPADDGNAEAFLGKYGYRF